MGGGGLQRRGGIIQGINVTPLVDITLVLMIVFIVTAKIMVTPAVPLDLPKASQSEELQTVFAVRVDPGGTLRVDGTPVAEKALEQRARAALASEPELRAVIQADGEVRHKQVIAVLDALKSAGLTRVAFATQAEQPQDDAAKTAEASEAETEQ